MNILFAQPYNDLLWRRRTRAMLVENRQERNGMRWRIHRSTLVTDPMRLDIDPIPRIEIYRPFDSVHFFAPLMCNPKKDRERGAFFNDAIIKRHGMKGEIMKL